VFSHYCGGYGHGFNFNPYGFHETYSFFQPLFMLVLFVLAVYVIFKFIDNLTYNNRKGINKND